MKKLSSTILASTMLLSTLSMAVTTSCATETTDTTHDLQQIHIETLTSGTCGDNATWSFDTATGALTISGTGDMADIKSNWPWREYNTDVKTLVISEGITSVGVSAFVGFRNMTSVSLPNTLTRIDNYGFDLCNALVSVTIPNSVTSIGTSAFNDCSSLTTLVIPDSVTSIGGHAFRSCSSLTSVTLPNSITIIDNYTFSYCDALTSVTTI